MDKKVLAKVDGYEITKDDMLKIISNMPPEARNQVGTKHGRKALLDEMISGELIYKKAIADGLDKEEKYLQILAEAKKNLLEQYAVTKLLSTITVTDDEVKKYYDEHKDEFAIGESVTAKHILVDKEEKIKEIKKEIEEGLDFSEAAQKYSTCPSKERGGDLGNFSRGKMVPEFEKVAFELETGQVSAPVKTPFGYHLIMTTEKFEKSTQEFGQVEQTIKQQLIFAKQKELYYANNKKLKEGHDIEIFEDNLD